MSDLRHRFDETNPRVQKMMFQRLTCKFVKASEEVLQVSKILQNHQNWSYQNVQLVQNFLIWKLKNTQMELIIFQLVCRQKNEIMHTEKIKSIIL